MSTQTAADRFEELYRTTRQDILAYLTRRAGDREQAADLLSETYLIAWRKLPQVPVGHEGRLWLFGVARNLLFKHKVANGHTTCWFSAPRKSSTTPSPPLRPSPIVLTLSPKGSPACQSASARSSC
jgi:DNA-directed RNA polymerase specialized sigma24 family protein